MKFSKIEKFYLSFVAGSAIFIFFLWLLNNCLRWPQFALKLGVCAAAYFLGFYLLKDIPAERETERKSHVLFNALLIFSVVCWLLPVVLNKDTPIGWSLKDLHDALTIYIADEGVAPDIASLPEIDILGNYSGKIYVPWIVEEGYGLWLTYPNGLHSVGAFFLKLGFPRMHGIFAAVIFAILVNSCALYLVLRAIFRDKAVAAIFGGLASLASYKIPELLFISSPQLFSFLLIIPALLLYWLAEEFPSFKRSFLFGCGIGALTVSYFGVSILFYVVLAALILGRSFFRPGRGNFQRSAGIICLSFLFFAGAAVKAGKFYWQNLFLNSASDPFDPGHFAIPLVGLFFSLLLLISLLFFFRRKFYRNNLAAGLLILAALALAPLFYWLIFSIRFAYSGPQDFYALPASGLFSGLRHQQMGRLSFFQPFIWIIFLPALPMLFKRRRPRLMVAALIAVLLLFSPQISFSGQTGAATNGQPFFQKYFSGNAVPFLAKLSFSHTYNVWDDNFESVLRWLRENLQENDSLYYIPLGSPRFNEWKWAAIYLQKYVGYFYRVENPGKKNAEIMPLTELRDDQIKKMLKWDWTYLFFDGLDRQAENFNLLKKFEEDGYIKEAKSIPAKGIYVYKNFFRQPEIPKNAREVDFEFPYFASGEISGQYWGKWSAQKHSAAAFIDYNDAHGGIQCLKMIETLPNGAGGNVSVGFHFDPNAGSSVAGGRWQFYISPAFIYTAGGRSNKSSSWGITLNNENNQPFGYLSFQEDSNELITQWDWADTHYYTPGIWAKAEVELDFSGQRYRSSYDDGRGNAWTGNWHEMEQPSSALHYLYFWGNYIVGGAEPHVFLDDFSYYENDLNFKE